jgi:hypothetical protein
LADWQLYAAGGAALLVALITLHLIDLLGTVTLLVLLSVVLTLYFVGVLRGRRVALIALATIVGGCVTLYASILFFALGFPSLGGMYLIAVWAPLIAPVGAAASGFFAFLMTKVKQETIRFALCGAVLAPTLATVITEVIVSQTRDPMWPSRLSSESVRAVGLSIGAIALVGALGGLAISHMTDR